MTRFSAAERMAIARGEFFTESELRARPWLGRSVIQGAAMPGRRVDPNTRPVSAEARKLAETHGVCAWCWEPGDDRSALVLQDDHRYRHPECQEENDRERASR
jgi:hypothetical protein